VQAEIGDAMGEALLGLLPLAVATALSSVSITATAFILLTDSRVRSGLAFLAGTVIGTLAAVTLATAASQALPGRSRQHDALVATAEVVVGIAMVLLGVVTLARRRRTGGARAKGWLEDIGSLGILPVFGIGLALNLRPKAALLAVAVGLGISKAGLRLNENLALILFYTTIATSTVVVPIVTAILFPGWMEPRLLAAKGWIGAHSGALSATITMAVGGFLITLGIRG
jgi:hypothetical protein